MSHNGRVRCVQLTDLHLDPDVPTPRDVPVWDHFNWACEMVRSLSPDLVVVTGDIALERGSPEIYRAVAPHLAELDTEVLLLPGNHDTRSDFHQAFGRRYKLDARWPVLDRLVEIGGYSMILLDSADGTLHERTLAWFDSLLDSLAEGSRRGLCHSSLIVWTHHPVITGFHRFMDENYPLDNGRELVRLCARHGETLRVYLFCGHYHTENHQVSDNLHQYCTPSTAMQIDPTTSDFRVESRDPALRLIDFDGAGRVETAVITPATRVDTTAGNNMGGSDDGSQTGDSPR